MYKGFGYAVTAHDGKGREVIAETGYIEDLCEVLEPLDYFLGRGEADSVLNDALDGLYTAHYAQDEIEPEIQWEVRCCPLLAVLGGCQS